MVPATPVNAELGLLGVARPPPAPDKIAQEPVPIVALFPTKAVLVPQMDWSVPAAATVGLATSCTTRSSLEAAQGALAIVHRSV